MRFLVPLALIATVSAGTLGVFRGKLVDVPAQQRRDGWIFVQSRKGVLRQVEISRARIVYSDSIPPQQRAKSPSADLVTGAEVMVTAEQDGAGEWHANEIEILNVNRQRAAR